MSSVPPHDIVLVQPGDWSDMLPDAPSHEHRCTPACCSTVERADSVRSILAHSKEELLEGLAFPAGLTVADVDPWPAYTNGFRHICDKGIELRMPATDGFPTQCPHCSSATYWHVGRRPELAGAWILNVSSILIRPTCNADGPVV